MRNIPNILTLLRIIIIPLIVLCYNLDNIWAKWIAGSLFLLASVTDFFDGHIARIYAIQTKLGKFLDPIADKLLISTMIIMLTAEQKIHIFPAMAIIGREILVSGLREYLAEINVDMPVSNLGKIKTTVQMGSLFLLIIGPELSQLYFVETIADYGIWLAAILTVVSGYIYLREGLKHMI